MKHWNLTAENTSGARVEFNAPTKRQVINKFDNIYARKGWIIVLTNEDNESGIIFNQIFFKKTYR
jgi:hypothetical protein